MMKRAIDWIRKKICPRRLYSHGILGLWFDDDRTRLEKVFDYIDKIVNRIDAYFKQPAYIRKQIFHSFFDISTDQVISSVGQINAICKAQGVEFSTFREIKDEAKKTSRHNELKKNRMIKDGIKEILDNVSHQRKSYKKEIMDNIKKGEYHIGQNPTFNKP